MYFLEIFLKKMAVSFNAIKNNTTLDGFFEPEEKEPEKKN
jgi:hypothetical protein